MVWCVGTGSSPRGSWRSLYKPSTEKRSADLQWRMVHGGTYRPQCRKSLCFLSSWRSFTILMAPLCQTGPPFCFAAAVAWWVGDVLENRFFIFGSRFSAALHSNICPVNFLTGQAKMFTWFTRRNKMKGTGWTDVEFYLLNILCFLFFYLFLLYSTLVHCGCFKVLYK